MNDEQITTGLAYLGRELTPENVEIVVLNGIIKEISPAKKVSDAIIIPKFFNAHTHLADTVAMDTPVDRPLAELVAPPNGLKHRILRKTRADDLVSAMRGSIDFMKEKGAGGFADFREGGAEGAALLQKSIDPEMQALILGRDGGEAIADGFGLSSAHGKESESKTRAAMKAAGKLFAVHVAEKGTDDIEDAFALEPDFMVHATHFRAKDIRRAADEDIPIVVCPRSNWTLNVAGTGKPPVRELIDAGCRVYLGTDNVMFVSPDMFAEGAFLHAVSRVESTEILRAAVSGFELAGIPWAIEEGNPARFNVINLGYARKWSRDIPASLFSYGRLA